MMFFVCAQCDSVDAVELAYPSNRCKPFPPNIDEQLCICCQPDERTWHGLFAQLRYNPEVDFVINRSTGLGLD